MHALVRRVFSRLRDIDPSDAEEVVNASPIAGLEIPTAELSVRVKSDSSEQSGADEEMDTPSQTLMNDVIEESSQTPVSPLKAVSGLPHQFQV